MPLIPAQRRPSTWKRATRVVAMLVLLLVAVGFIFDLVSGLPLLRSSRSWTAWSVGIVALGVLFVMALQGIPWVKTGAIAWTTGLSEESRRVQLWMANSLPRGPSEGESTDLFIKIEFHSRSATGSRWP